MVDIRVPQTLICRISLDYLVKRQILNLWVWAGPGIMHLEQVLIHRSYSNSRNLQPIMVENGVFRLWRWACWNGLRSKSLFTYLSRRVKRRWKKVKELHCSEKHQNYWVRGHGGRSVSANNGSWPVEAWWGPQSSETTWAKLPLQAVEREAIYAFTDLQANIFTWICTITN